MCKFGDEITLLSSVARNKTLFCLRVFLTELWLERPFEELLEIEVQLLPGLESFQSYRETIDRIVEKLYDDAGQAYNDAIRHCLHCDFDRRKINSDDAEFCGVFYGKVVSPLEKTYDILHNPPV